MVDLGPGIQILEVEVLEADHLRVEVDVDSAAELGSRDVVVTSGAEVAVGTSLVTLLDTEGDDEGQTSADPSGCSCASGTEAPSPLVALALLGLLLVTRRRGGRDA